MNRSRERARSRIHARLSEWIGRAPGLLAATFGITVMPIGLILAQQDAAFLWLAVLAGFLEAGASTLMVFAIPGEAAPPSLVATTYALLFFVG